MTTPLQPGVFVNVSQTPLAQSITSIPGQGQAAFAAAYNRGPVVPTLITSWPQFTKYFGSFQVSAGNLLHQSVYQFFANGGSQCYVARIPNTDAATATLNLSDLGMAAPAQPALTNAATGGTVLAGVYQVKVTYVNAQGETLPSTAGSTTTAGTTSTITIPSPPASGSATGWYAYVTQANGSSFTRQQTVGSPTVIGTALTLTAPPTSGGAQPPATDTATDPIMTVKASSPGAWGNTVYVALTTAGVAGRFNILVYVGGTGQAFLQETFPNLSVNPSDTRYVASVLNSSYGGSQYINVTVTLPTGGYVAGATDPALITATALGANTAGSDGVTAPTLATAVPPVLDQLQNQILYVNLPGITDSPTLNAMLTWADGRGDVMVIIDGPAPTSGETSAQVATNYLNMVQGSNVINADANAILYAPWLNVLDPSSAVVGATRFVPPGGAVLGVWQKGLTQFGIAQPPAGPWATLNVQGLEVKFTATDLQNLNQANVNAIKALPNTGFCVFGARTLAVGVPSRYVNVQRTLIQLSHDMQNLIQFATFQPNNSTLWQAITSTLNKYLTQQMQSGALAGSTPSTSFIVTCDSTNNTPTTAQGGVVNVTVGVALNSPAEFIIINLQQLSASASITS